MLIKLKIAVNPDYYNGKKVIIVQAWKTRGTQLAIHKQCYGKGWNITQTQVGLYLPNTSNSLCEALSRYKKLIAVSWHINKPVFGKHLGKKYKKLENICKNT